MRRVKVLPAVVAVVLAAAAAATPVLAASPGTTAPGTTSAGTTAPGTTSAGIASAQAASGPSPAQIRKAVAGARQSKNLWATINVCGPHRRPHTIGVRAQMPGLGFAAQLSVSIQIDYWNVAKRRFMPVLDPNAHGVVRFGTVTAGLEQGGEDFAFTHGAFLRATVTFTYRRNGHLLLTVTHPTAGHHPNADQGIPVHYSAATCRLP